MIKHSFITKCSWQLNIDFLGVLFYSILECLNKLNKNSPGVAWYNFSFISASSWFHNLNGANQIALSQM